MLNNGLRDMKRELCAFAGLALNLDIAPMCADNAARNGEPQPGASAATAGPRSVATIETFEDVWDVLGADAFSGITHGHFHAFA
jgi:hypothetical protein